MVDKKDLENQDFIEGEDDLANSLDNMNFEPVDHDDIPSDENRNDHDNLMSDAGIDDADSQNVDFIDADIEDEWAEDFGDDLDADDDFSAYDDNQSMGGGHAAKAERNWFNIGVFGALGLGVCFILYSYLPGILGGDDSSSNTQPVQMAQTNTNNQNNQNNQGDITAVTQQNTATSADLAQQALSPAVEVIEQAGGLLANPALLGDGVQSPERPDPEAADNRIFEALNESTATANQDVEDIFSALENLQSEQAGNNQNTEISQTNTAAALPQAADSMLDANNFEEDESILAGLEEFTNTTPRTPSQNNQIPDFAEANVANSVQSPDLQSAESAPPELQELDNIRAEQTVDNTPPLNESVDQASAQTAQASVSSQQIDALNNRMDTIMARLETLASQLDSQSAAITSVSSSSSTPNQTGTDNAAVASMENTIRNLEKRIESLSRETTTQPVRKTAAPTPRKAPTPRASAQRPAKQSVQWELRGASPGNAYVAQKGTQNLRTVGVGDNLSGVGRITSIAVESGRWVVRGTSGSIYQ